MWDVFMLNKPIKRKLILAGENKGWPYKWVSTEQATLYTWPLEYAADMKFCDRGRLYL